MYYLIEGVNACLYIIKDEDIKKDQGVKLVVGSQISFYYRLDKSKRRRLCKGSILQISAKLNVIERSHAAKLAEREKLPVEENDVGLPDSSEDEQEKNKVSNQKKRKRMSDPLEKGNKKTTEELVEFLRNNKASWRKAVPSSSLNTPVGTKTQKKSKTRRSETPPSRGSPLPWSRSPIDDFIEHNAMPSTSGKSSTVKKKKKNHIFIASDDDSSFADSHRDDSQQLRKKNSGLPRNRINSTAKGERKNVENSETSQENQNISDSDESSLPGESRSDKAKHTVIITQARVHQNGISKKDDKKIPPKKSSNPPDPKKGKIHPMKKCTNDNFDNVTDDGNDSHDEEILKNAQEGCYFPHEFRNVRNESDTSETDRQRKRKRDIMIDLCDLFSHARGLCAEFIELDNVSVEDGNHRNDSTNRQKGRDTDRSGLREGPVHESTNVPKNFRRWPDSAEGQIKQKFSNKNQGSHNEHIKISTNRRYPDDEISSASSEAQSTSGKSQFRWAKSDAGAEELVENTGIFVNSASLEKITRNATGQTSLARALLEAVFTDETLRTHSLTGGAAKGTGKDKINERRPGLDQNAITVILNYVTAARREKHWARMDEQLIRQSLRSKLQELKLESN